MIAAHISPADAVLIYRAIEYGSMQASAHLGANAHIYQRDLGRLAHQLSIACRDVIGVIGNGAPADVIFGDDDWHRVLALLADLSQAPDIAPLTRTRARIDALAKRIADAIEAESQEVAP